MASNIISLDVGERRVGVAIASLIARFPRPLTTLTNSDDIWQQIDQLVTEHDVETIVVGLPRNLSGDDTAQTVYARNFADKLRGVTIIFQDEALTSVKAEKELKDRGKVYNKGDVDALAATYILEDYLASHGVSE
jgi:putative holliday junction resolvase